ncbi:MAG: hypothetical protein F6K10_02155 [Moorea sp. SIO2B7]|nr:hypothetical protein [Moorena sp. SIO2B7]
MQEYLDSGLRLGWLINPQQKQIEIYHPNKAVEIVNMPIVLSGENILPELNRFFRYFVKTCITNYKLLYDGLR